jgi:nucleolar protein 6
MRIHPHRSLFVLGNLKYTTSHDTIKEHFAACGMFLRNLVYSYIWNESLDPPPTIRLLTPKQSATGKPTIKSKGCAFLEFSHRNALQQALKLHQSEVEGRRINVELTAGGGGKGESRLSKVKERNKELDGQRVGKLSWCSLGAISDRFPKFVEEASREAYNIWQR